MHYGHIKYENSETEYRKPQSLHILSPEERNVFFSVSEIKKTPEIGSRAMQRILIYEKGSLPSYWIHVQERMYSYSVSVSLGFTIVKILIRDYLACEVIWKE